MLPGESPALSGVRRSYFLSNSSQAGAERAVIEVGTKGLMFAALARGCWMAVMAWAGVDVDWGVKDELGEEGVEDGAGQRTTTESNQSWSASEKGQGRLRHKRLTGTGQVS